MFRKMRRYKQELSDDECIDILINEPRGVLAVLGENNYPYTVPMNHIYIDGKIYFHGAKEGHKNDSIRKHEKVSYCVIDKGFKKEDNWWYTFKSVVVFGKIKTIENDLEKINILTSLGNKFSPDEKEIENEIKQLIDKTEIFELTMDHISGKKVKEK